MTTHDICIFDKTCDESRDTIDILATFNESETFRPGDFTNDVKGEELQPTGKVAGGAGTGETGFGLGEEGVNGRVDEGFKGDEGAKGVGVCDATAEAGVVGFITRGEEGVETFAALDAALDGVVGRLVFVRGVEWLEEKETEVATFV